MKRRQRIGLLATIVGLLGIVFATGAAAAGPVIDATPQKGANKLQISEVDATDPANVSVRFTWNGNISQLQSMTVRQNGNQVPTTNPESVNGDQLKRGTAIVLDQSGSMVKSGALANAVEKVKQMIADASSGERFAIVTFGSQAVIAQSMTADKHALDRALDGIKPDPRAHTALWDGVSSGMAELDKLPGYEHDLVLVTDGHDDSSKATAKQVQGDVAAGQGQGATVFALGIDEPGGLDKSGLSQLVRAGGGRFFIAPQAKDLGAAFDQVTEALGNEFKTTFKAIPKSRGANTLEMTVAGVSTQVGFTIGGVAQGATDLSPTVAAPPSSPAFFRTTAGLALALLLFGLAIGGAAYVAFYMLSTRTSALDAALNPYTEGFVAGSADEDEATGLSQSALLQRALAMTEEFAERQGFLETVESKLEMAEVPLKAAEALLIWALSLVVLTVIGFILGGVLIAAVLLILGILAGPAILNFMAKRRQRKFEEQLPDTLTLLAGALRAGFSLMQAVDAVSLEVVDPMGKELKRVVSEARLGRDLEDALDDTAIRTGSADFAWAVMAVRIQREVGETSPSSC